MLEGLKSALGLKAKTDRVDYVRSTIKPEATYGQSRATQDQAAALRLLSGYVYAAVMMNARSIAAQPLRLYASLENTNTKHFPTKQASKSVTRYLKGDASVRPAKSAMLGANTGGEVVEIFDHPVLDLLNKVSPFYDGYNFAVLRKIFLQATGNEYLHPIMGPMGYPVELWVMPSQFVKILPTRDERLIEGYEYGQQPNQTVFAPDEVLHNRIPDPSDPLYGRGWVNAASDAAGLLHSMDDYEKHLFENQARPDWGIFLKETLNETQWNRMVAYLDQNLRGNRNSGRPYIFEGGSDARPLQFSPRDLSFSEGESRKVEVIAAASGVPVTLLKANDPNLASAQVGFASYMRDTIHPYLTADAEFLNQSLLPLFGSLADGLFLAYDNPVQEDEQRVSQILTAEVQAGLRTINEARSELGLDPSDDGDDLRVNGVRLDAVPTGGLSPFGPLSIPEPTPVPQESQEQEAEEATMPQVEAGVAAAQDAALNGAQIQQILAIADKVNLGELTAEAGYAIALAAFPGIPNERLEEIFSSSGSRGFKAPRIREGSFVEWRTEKGKYLGKVRRLKRSGSVPGAVGGIEASEEDPIAFVQVYVREEDGSFTPSDRETPVLVSRLSPAPEPEKPGEKAVSAKVKEALEKKVEEHNEEVGDAKSKRTNLRTLTAVYERGLAAYRGNPASVRPTVQSADQWAMARVNGFLHALRTGKFKRKPFDTDLLPDSHPLAGKEEGEKAALENFPDVFTEEEEARNRAEELGCEGIHEHPGDPYGFDGVIYMPCTSHRDYEALIQEQQKKYEEIDFTPPEVVQEEAQRGLDWRKEFGRGGTEVGVARARDLSNGVSVSPETVRRMVNFFTRHEVDKQAEGFDRGEDGYPSAGRIAWALWGGDPGQRWANSIRDRMDAEDERGEKVARREGESLDDCVARGIDVLLAEGYERDQAVAIAYRQCGSATKRAVVTWTGMEPEMQKKCLEGKPKEDWPDRVKEARKAIEDVDDYEAVPASEDIRKGEPRNPAQRIQRNLVKVFENQRQEIVKSLRGAKGGKKQFTPSDMATLLQTLANFEIQYEEAVAGPIAEATAKGGDHASKEVGVLIGFDVTNPKVAEFAATYAQQFAAEASRASLKRARTVIARGLEEGSSVGKIAEQIQTDYGFSPARATVVARTETARAFVEGERLGWQESGVVEGKEWQLAAGGCPFCQVSAALQPRVRNMDQPFWRNGQEIVAPGGTYKIKYGDVQGAPLHPNCRCDLLPVLETPSELS